MQKDEKKKSKFKPYTETYKFRGFKVKNAAKQQKGNSPIPRKNAITGQKVRESKCALEAIIVENARKHA